MGQAMKEMVLIESFVRSGMVTGQAEMPDLRFCIKFQLYNEYSFINIFHIVKRLLRPYGLAMTIQVLIKSSDRSDMLVE